MIEAYLEALIAGQRRAGHWYAVVSSATVAVGVLSVLAALLLEPRIGGEYLKTVLTIGGGFIASAAALPVKEIVASKNRIDLYQRFRLRLSACPPEEAEQIRTVIWAAIGKLVGA